MSETLRLLRSGVAGVEVGSPPGTMFDNPDAQPTTVTVYRCDASSVHEWILDAEAQWSLPVVDGGFSWIRVQGFADTDHIQGIADSLSLHRLTAADLVNLNQRTKTEEYEDHVLALVRAPVPGDEDGTRTQQLCTVWGQDFVLSCEECRSPLLDAVAERLHGAPGVFHSRGVDYIAYCIVDIAIDSFFPVIERFGELIEAAELRAIEQPDTRSSRLVHSLRSDLLLLRKAIWPLREVTNILHHSASSYISDHTRIYFRDCHDHAVHLNETVDIYREIAFALVEVYMSSLNTRMNEIMQVLTIIATIFMPLSFIASLYGMNFDRASPWNMPELGWYLGYPFALTLMAITTIGMLWYFRRKRWIGRDRD